MNMKTFADQILSWVDQYLLSRVPDSEDNGPKYTAVQEKANKAEPTSSAFIDVATQCSSVLASL
jgi:hypothetical protein